MRFGKKLLAAIERGEWVRRRNWHEGFKMRKGDEGFFVDEMGYAVAVPVDAAAVLADDWVIVRKKRKAPKADDPRYEPIEQFIQKLEELERTVTRGQWKVDEYDGFMRVYADFDPESPRRDYGVIHCATCAPAPLDNGNAHGIAHLKNSNPTIIAMLTAAMKELQGIVEYWNGAPESAVDAIETVADRAHNCLAHLNTLAASALGTKGARDE